MGKKKNKRKTKKKRRIS